MTCLAFLAHYCGRNR